MSLTSKLEIIASMDATVADGLSLLKTVEQSWQPTDFLPDLTKDDWREKVQELRENARCISDEVWVILVGMMVTEEALPSYQTSFNRLPGVNDPTGAHPGLWAQWTRGWTAEENRHGDLLNRYLYLTGRVNMRAVEVTIQYLIKNGFDPKHDNDPYKGMIYTSFQERATRISHGKLGELVRKQGEVQLGKICNTISGDEARHEEAYKRFMRRIFELDPGGAMIAFHQMIEKFIVMPAHLMHDGQRDDLFTVFSGVAQRKGVYTSVDYVDILKHLIDYWSVDKLTSLSGDAAKAQDELCKMPQKLPRWLAIIDARVEKQKPEKFSWIYDRTA
jgi:acyl-[acyl-carrier-protein] desaturase